MKQPCPDCPDGYLWTSKGPTDAPCKTCGGKAYIEQDQKGEEVMSEWQLMETAPRDGTVILARIPGNGECNLLYWMDGLLDSNGDDVGGWAFAEDQESPDCWTDSICWEVNEDGVASVKPTHWKPIPRAAS